MTTSSAALLPSSLPQITAWLVSVAALLMWAAWFMMWRSPNINTGGRGLVLWWAFNSALFLTVYAIVRFWFGVMWPYMTLWAAICWIQAATSIVLYIVAWNRVKRQKSG